MEQLIGFLLYFALVTYLMLFSFFNACLSYFLDKTFEDGMIFGMWLPFLERNIGETNFWYKPLGGCLICFNIWLSVPMYIFCIYFFELMALGAWHFPLWVIYATVSNFMVRKMIGD